MSTDVVATDWGDGTTQDQAFGVSKRLPFCFGGQRRLSARMADGLALLIQLARLISTKNHVK